MNLAGAYPGFNDDYNNRRWEPETYDTLEAHLSPGSLLIDIGAWIGPVTRWALDLGADVVAYEPDPVACGHLYANCPDAVTQNVAVTDRYGTALLTNDGFWGDSTTRITDDGVFQVKTIPAWATLSERVTLIKVDVEGHETVILPHLLQHATCPIWVAWHEKLWPADHRWDFGGWDVDGPVTGWGHSLLTRKA